MQYLRARDKTKDCQSMTDRQSCSKQRKTSVIYQIINVFRFISERNRTVRSGARGSRTLVQTGKPYAFYTLSHRWNFRAQARPRPPTCALSSKMSPLHRGLQRLVPICLHHRVGLLRNNSVRVMSRPRTWCRD